jgi:hypothetical protein
MYRVCRRRAAVRAALPAPSQEELITYVDAPCYFRDEPRPTDGGMPRFATQMEAEAAHQAAIEGLSTERMTWEEYAATHPHESMGAAPMPRSQAFLERREGQLKSANDCLSPAPPPSSSSSDEVTRNVRPRLGSRADADSSSESPDLENLEPQPAWRGTRDLFDSDSDDDDEPPRLVVDTDDEDDDAADADPEAGRPMTPPSPPPQRRFRFLGQLRLPADQHGFRFLRRHQRPPDLPNDDDEPRHLIGPVRPTSPDSVAQEHMINATGGDSQSSPPPGHGVLDSGSTTTVLATSRSTRQRPTVTSWQWPREEAHWR